jgi:ubiquitin carboxyl-terminal hydrolase 4/11/15
MSERSYSHKSVGGQSSTGHSVHSAISGHTNSLTGYGLNPSTETPGLAPGLFILGSVPAIIRCWLTTTFKHDTMLYAAVCTGSYASYLHLRLINRLGFQDRISKSKDGTRRIELPVYLPEAIPVSASSRSSSPAPQLPYLTVEFVVVENDHDEESKAIQIFLGSDMMRAHNADVLFSSNQLTLYDDDGSKLRIPLVRPEDERTFKSLCTTSGSLTPARPQCEVEDSAPTLSKAGAGYSGEATNADMPRSSTVPFKVNGNTTIAGSEDGSTGRRSLEQRPHIGLSTMASKEPQDSSPASATPRSGVSPAIWNNWRRDTENPSSVDWANVGKPSSSTYQRRDTGIKVLKKPGTRTLSASISQGSSTATGQSRFFDDGKRRESNVSETEGLAAIPKRTVSGEKSKENVSSSNPVGGASAFAWLNTKGIK